jgi:hypothetical protein
VKFPRRLGLAILLLSLVAISFAQSDNPPARTGAKSGMKEACKSSKQAAQKNGRAAKKTTKREPTRLLKPPARRLA